MLFGPDRPFWFGLHRSWRVWAVFALFTLIAFLPLLLSWVQQSSGGAGFDWLRGSSTFGILCGLFGGYLIALEMLLWVRKRFRGYASTHVNGGTWPLAFALSFPALGLGLFLWVTNVLGLSRGTDQTRYECWRKVRNGWWPIAFGIMFLFQVPLYLFYFFWLRSASSRAEAQIRILLNRFGYRSPEDAAKETDEKKRNDFAAAKMMAIENEKQKVRGFYLSTQIWMWGHIWFGFISFALIVAHTGYNLGGPMTKALTILFVFVIVSGVWGLFLQNRLPKSLRDEVLEETVASQISWVLEKRIPEALRLIKEITGKTPPEPAEVPTERDHKQYLVSVEDELSREMKNPRLRELFSYFVTDIQPYLLMGNESTSNIKSADKAKVIFDRFRANLPEVHHASLGSLEQICSYRRQLDDQDRINRWLHNWIAVHLPVSVAMFTLMIVHVMVALKYW